MASINNATLSYPNSISPLTKPRFITSSTGSGLSPNSTNKPFIIRCSSNNGVPKGQPSNTFKDALTGMVGKEVEDLLNREENRELLDGLVEASDRVERAKRELAEIERQQLEATQMRNYVNQLQSRANEIAECQQEILEARAKLEEAERSLTLNVNGNGYGVEAQNDSDKERINKDEDRLESIKAASISAIVGTLASLPVSLAQATSMSEILLPSAITFVSCALYGVTFRYAIRRDLDDFHLKSGTIAAFGFVKGLGMLAGGPPLELTPASLLSHAFDGAILVSENLLIFAFAAVSMDFCFRMRLLSPFPSKNTNV